MTSPLEQAAGVEAKSERFRGLLTSGLPPAFRAALDAKIAEGKTIEELTVFIERATERAPMTRAAAMGYLEAMSK